MVSLTPEMAGNSLVIIGVGYVVTIAFSIYSLYLNWKQSKVRDTTQKLVDLEEKNLKVLQQIEMHMRVK